MNFKGKKILIVGFGVSGQAAARFLVRSGAKVAVTDARRKEDLGPFPKDLRDLEGHWGGHPEEAFRGRDLIVLSPGVPGDLPELKRARKRGAKIVGEFGLSASLLEAPMIAVTGTNGKSTTVSLIDAMLRAARKKVALGGNIGTPLMEIVAEERDKKPARPVRGAGARGTPKVPPFEWIVAEVSSYQLETCVKPFKPRIAVLLNVTEDHLDRYPSFEAYAKAKFRVFADQTAADTLIYGADDEVVAKGVKKAKSKKVPISVSGPADRIVHDGHAYPLANAKLKGVHNRENMTAAIAAARAAGVAPAAIQRALESFEGLPHRTQFVRERDGVRYYDDSKGTNVDAAVKSLLGFDDGRVVLIAGGRDKGGSYAPLRDAARRKTKLVLTIGEAGPAIAKALKGGVEVVPADTLDRAVRVAAERAKPGDSVLLSPACSSFDQFRDYKDRGDAFQRLVKQL